MGLATRTRDGGANTAQQLPRRLLEKKYSVRVGSLRWRYFECLRCTGVRVNTNEDLDELGERVIDLFGEAAVATAERVELTSDARSRQT
jgi:hypothetical protein